MSADSGDTSSLPGLTALPRIVPLVKIRMVPTTPGEQQKKKIVVNAKSYTHPWENREELSDAYELPISQRELWWRKEIKVTPVPGAYESTDFIAELIKRPNTYNFKSKGRKGFRDFTRSGLYLLPGGYESQDFLKNLSVKPATYSFKTGERFATDVLNFGIKDKYVNVPPNAYNTQKYLAVDEECFTVKNYMFRSQCKRFPPPIFRQRDGPSPTTYTVKDSASGPAITSCFESKIPRFQDPHFVK